MLFFSLMGFKGFSAIPFVRVGIIMFSGIYFLNKFVGIKIPVKVRTNASIQDSIILFWISTAVLSLFVGAFRNNPTMYFITDFVYVFFGVTLYYVISRDNFNLSRITYRPMSILTNALSVLAIICIVFSFDAPAVLLIMMSIMIYVNIIAKKQYKVLLLLLPFIIIMASSNRTQLIIFIFMLFILLLKRLNNRFSKRSVFIWAATILTIGYVFKENILESLFLVIDRKSNIGYRIDQLVLIFKNGIDYSDPFFTSIAQRVLEANAVIDYWTTDLFTFLFGTGSGGVIDGSKIFSDSSVLGSALLGGEKVHNIHLLPFAFLFRYGFFGLLLMIMLTILAYKAIVRVLDEDDNLGRIFWNLFFVFWFFFSIPAGAFLWTMPIFWIALSMINHYEKNHFAYDR
ncbi:MAG: hypothetical protein KJP09_02585 [Bacteroidia bacterium]|nr:hypothetical protein [Bacteroidia bacterium]